MNNNNNNNTNGFSPAIQNVFNNPSPELNPATGGFFPPAGDYFLVSDTGTYLIAADGTYLISNH